MWLHDNQGDFTIVRWQEGVVPNPLVTESRWVSLDQAIGKQPKGCWIVDISHERLLTSEALAILVGLVSRINAAGGHLKLAGATPAVALVMKSMRLDRLLSLYPDVDGACAALHA